MTTERSNGSPPIKPGSFLMRLAAVLFCLVMFSTYLMAGLFARYSTVGDGTDAARVAKFSVQAFGSTEDVVIKSGYNSDSGSYVITVANESEVAVACSVDITFDSELSEKISMKLDGTVGTKSADGKTVRYADIAVLAPGESRELPLMFTVQDWTVFTADAENTLAFSKDLTFTVSVDTVQVD